MGKRKVRHNEDDEVKDIIMSKVNHFRPKNQSQKEYANLIYENEIVICSGPAGTGKSHTAIAIGLELVRDNLSPYKKLIVCTPAIEAEENLGFLPGSMEEKLAPYLASSVSLIDKVIGKVNREALTHQNIIEIEALAYIRGKTIDNAIFIMEEAQNMTPNQMKTLLTRIGDSSKFIISGDLEQSDRYKTGKESGLHDAMTRLEKVKEIGFFEFKPEDIVRNKIISKILKCYNQTDKEKDFFIPVKPENDPTILSHHGDGEIKKIFKVPVGGDDTNKPKAPKSQIINEGKFKFFGKFLKW